VKNRIEDYFLTIVEELIPQRDTGLGKLFILNAILLLKKLEPENYF